MKIKIYLFSLFSLFLLFSMSGQIPSSLNSSGNTSYSSGYHNLSGSSINIGTTTYQNSSISQLDVKARNEIKIQSEMTVNNLSGSGYAHFYIDPNLLDISSFHPNGFYGIPQYDKFEIGIRVPDNIQTQINSFLLAGTNGANKINPYDPDQIKIECSFSDHSVPVQRYGFYYRDFTSSVVTNTWTEQSTPYTFRIRFAPPDVGNFTSNVNLYINNILVSTTSFMFNVASNPSNHGHIFVDPNTAQRLTYKDGTPFFGVGANIPWASNALLSTTSNPEAIVGPEPAKPENHDVHRQLINDLGTNGGNFVRIRLDPWSVPIENKDPSTGVNTMPLINYLNNYDHNQKSMWEMDKTLSLCESLNVKLLLTLIYSETDNGTPYYGTGWSDSPYSALVNDPSQAGVVNFFSNASSKDYLKKRFFYIAARWGYSTSIGLWAIYNELDLMNQYATIKSDVINWAADMTNFLHTQYPMHPVTIGLTYIPNFRDYPFMDVNEYHAYMMYDAMYNVAANANGHYYNDNYYTIVQEISDSMFFKGKPYVLGELGQDFCSSSATFATVGNPSTRADYFNDRGYHNRLWASTMGGSMSAGLNFFDWGEKNVSHRANNFPAIKYFMSQVDLSKVLIPALQDNNVISASGKQVFNFQLKEASRNYLAGWSSIGSSNWSSDDPSSFEGNWYDMQACIPTLIEDYDVTTSSQDPYILISNLGLATTQYKVEFYKTYGTGGSLGAVYVTSNLAKNIIIRRSFMNHHNNSVSGGDGPDVAYIVSRDVSGSRLMAAEKDTLQIQKDSSFCITSSSKYSEKNYDHFWSFGNNIISTDANPCTIFTQSGTYLIEHYITPKDSSIEKPASTSQWINVDLKSKINERVYPVPSSNNIVVNYDKFNWDNPKTFIINSLGQQFEIMISDLNKVDVSAFPNGFYTLRLVDATHEKSFKIIVQH